jgi:hypothetical protein
MAAPVLLAAATAACSPALNWREVPLKGLVAMLPCKPDNAERPIQLGPSNTRMQVSGCETAGALYAISHVQVADPTQLKPTQDAWREISVAAMQAGMMSTQTLRMAKPRAPFSLETMQGRRPDGTPLQAQMTWLSNGLDLYQVAVYGNKLDTEMTELLFSELRLP